MYRESFSWLILSFSAKHGRQSAIGHFIMLKDIENGGIEQFPLEMSIK